MTQDIQAVEKLVNELQTGMKALSDTHAQAKKDTDALVQGKLDRVVEDVTSKLEAIQAKQAKFEAAQQRLGQDGNDSESPEAKAQKSAFMKWMRKGDRALNADEAKALVTDQADNGGYMLPANIQKSVVGRIFETSPLRRVATVITVGSKGVDILLDDDEASAGWIGENDSATETNTPTVGNIEINAKKMYAYPKISAELAQDAAFDVEMWLKGKLVDKFGRVENTAFVVGAGVNSPRGFLTYTQGSGTYARSSIDVVNSGSTSTPTESGLIDLQCSLKEAYQPNAVWLMNRSTLGLTMKLAGSTQFRFLNLQPQVGPSGVQFGSLSMMDKPVILCADMPVVASNSLSIAYGDFGAGYTIVDRVGISLLADPYTSPGQIKYQAFKRVGGGVTNFEAIKIQKFA